MNFYEFVKSGGGGGGSMGIMMNLGLDKVLKNVFQNMDGNNDDEIIEG